MIAKVDRIHEFRRMMQSVSKNNWQQQWMMVLLVGLFMGLLVSRALVSFASILIVIPFLFNYRNPTINKKYLLSIFLIIVPVIVSFFWSDDKNLWWNSLSVKIPLLTMMLGLTAVQLTKTRWLQVVWIYIVVISIGCCWSLWQYINDAAVIEQAYLKAKTLPTPSDNDHIRFSWMVVTAVLLGIKCRQYETRKKIKIILTGLLLFLIVYLHILAAKTGLACLYAACLMYVLHIIFIQKKWKTGLTIAMVAAALASLCYFSMPTLRNRIQYVRYDFSNYSKGNSMPGYGDASRWLSIKAGAAITNEHPFTGVGFGDLRSSINQWHEKNHPSSLPYERFLPANEWLVYGAGAGWPGIICFTLGFLLLLYHTTSKNILSIIVSVVSIIPFLIDDTLEGQYGIIILAFIAFFGQQKLSPPVSNNE